MVIVQQGIAATSNVLASQAGAQILADGGSAADAAIAANAVLGVVEPMMNGMGGDLFVLYWEARTGQITGLNASGPAPLGLSPELIAALGVHAMSDAGIHCVTVPGAVDGWWKMHEKFGKLPWKRLFQPAIEYAEQGFPVSEIIQELWADPSTLGKLRAFPESTRVFLPRGDAPAHGEIFRNPDLAAAYRMVADEGPPALYTGAIAAAILKTSQSMSGTMTSSDLASFSAEWVEPISIDYRGWRIFELPPNGQGMAALEMLNIMEMSPADAEGPLGARELHKRIESMKLAYADTYRYNADPRYNEVPVEALLSKAYARERAALIDSRRANGNFPHGRVPGTDTIYLTVVDRQGNIASWIQSVYAGFGSGITVEGMGFPLQNRGAGFSLDPSHPNVLAGGKRPYHTIIPGFMEHGDLHAGFGIMGGANQPLAHAQFVSNVVDYGMNLQQAMEAPRFFKGSPDGCEVSIEARVPESTLKQLADMGHLIAVRPEYSQEMGRGQAILHNSSTRTNFAASDPRSDGAAIPEPIRTQSTECSLPIDKPIPLASVSSCRIVILPLRASARDPMLENLILKKKICMLGYYGVGKTSLVSQFVNQLFADKYQTTVGVKIDKKVVTVDGHEVTLMLWDVAGEEDQAPVKLNYARDASGYLLVLDGCRKKTLDAAIRIQQRMQEEIGRRPFLLLANKADEREKWEITDAAFQDLVARGWTVLETSAKTGENVERAFLTLTAAILKASDEAADGEEE